MGNESTGSLPIERSLNWRSRGRVGVATTEITPEVGTYHRMWGAASHDVSEGVHRPLTATALALAPPEADGTSRLKLLLAVDHCLLESSEVDSIRDSVASHSGIESRQTIVCFSHTHAAGLLSRQRHALPGGELIGPYLDRLKETLTDLARQAIDALQPARWRYATGACQLASNRDWRHPETNQWVCGHNAAAPADDTVLVAEAVGENGNTIATVLNYACHPTTLAWDNRLISPDYPGAARDVVQQATAAPCVFLLGACGDLGPKEGFVGDTEVADRNGRQLGYAALSALESMGPVESQYEFDRAVVSGATIAAWKWNEPSPSRAAEFEAWSECDRPLQLPYRPELPTVDEVEREGQQLESQADAARQQNDLEEAGRLRALAERKRRLKERLSGLPPGDRFPFEAHVWRMGDALWVTVQGEPYNCLQTRLRAAFPDRPVVVTAMSNGWGPSYLPPREMYGTGVYQESIASLAPGSLETLIDELIVRGRTLFANGSAEQ